MTQAPVNDETPSKRKKTSFSQPPEVASDPAIDDFLERFNQDLHRPKPGQDAVAAALQAVQQLAMEVDAEDASLVTESRDGKVCQSCGGKNPASNRFCSLCGVPFQAPEKEPAKAETLVPESESGFQKSPEMSFPGEHHYHHHYHHHYFSYSGDAGAMPGSEMRIASPGMPPREPIRGRASVAGTALSRAETAVRKIMQDWAQACNTKQLDDLVTLYGTDALVLRPNVPAVRGASAIREFFFALLDGGLGDVEIEPLRTEVAGDLAYEAGRCTMLVPVAVSKRREERGKYLAVFSRQAGEWRIVADCWSSDLNLAASPETVAPKSGK